VPRLDQRKNSLTGKGRNPLAN